MKKALAALRPWFGVAAGAARMRSDIEEFADSGDILLVF